MIHHIAIGTTNLIRLSDFYLQLPGIKLLNKNYFENSEELRSVWLQHIDGTIIMLEMNDQNKAPLALVFELSEMNLESFKEEIIKRTDYTIYFHDTDGNVLGYSRHPKLMGNSSNF
jgi:catechol 2,3-dioxygenase-like lactoylglutathione lyase family enzyme